MNSSGRSATCGRALAAGLLLAALSWALLVSASPESHARVHPDANRADHVCAITLLVSGSYEHGGQPQVLSAPSLDIEFPGNAALPFTWVEPLFLNAHIFAHAPPVHS